MARAKKSKSSKVAEKVEAIKKSPPKPKKVKEELTDKEVCDKEDDCWANLEDQNNHHVRVVTDVDVDDNDLKKAFGEDKYSVFNIENKKLNNEGINIDQDNNELVYAAIFSENKEHYDCMMTNAMSSLRPWYHSIYFWISL